MDDIFETTSSSKNWFMSLNSIRYRSPILSSSPIPGKFESRSRLWGFSFDILPNGPNLSNLESIYLQKFNWFVCHNQQPNFDYQGYWFDLVKRLPEWRILALILYSSKDDEYCTRFWPKKHLVLIRIPKLSVLKQLNSKYPELNSQPPSSIGFDTFPQATWIKYLDWVLPGHKNLAFN